MVSCTREMLGVGRDAPFALLNPGAAWPNKRWPAERFGEVARQLRERQGLRSAVLWGPDEATLAAAVARASGDAARMAPQTTMVEMLALAQASSVMVSGDTGPLHLAAAVGTPVVGLYGPTPPGRNGPWDPLRQGRLEPRVVRLRLQAPVHGAHMVPRAGDGGLPSRLPSSRAWGRRDAPPCPPPGRRAPAWRAGVCRSGSRRRRLVLWLARPTPRSLQLGLPIALLGQVLRIWAAGHLEKSREVTSSGPYRFTRHPLYLGSSLMGRGSHWRPTTGRSAVLIAGYLASTLWLAIRTEEAYLRATFGDAYDRYAVGDPARGDARRFSLARASATRSTARHSVSCW